ncbi:enhanced serine sensitivity protein SseB C-terminal domain-containing protein, partial [Streptomyces hyaluromycini]
VQPALGAPYLAIGLDVYDTSPPAVDSVRAMMQQSIGAVPDGLPVSTVAMTDEYDPVVMWMRATARPFYDREAHAQAPVQAPAAGYGYPGPGVY